jgi:hypothetical protein
VVQEGALTQQSEGVDRQGRGAGRRWGGGRKRQEGTPSDSRLGAREQAAVDRVRRGGGKGGGGAPTTKKETPPVRV